MGSDHYVYLMFINFLFSREFEKEFSNRINGIRFWAGKGREGWNVMKITELTFLLKFRNIIEMIFIKQNILVVLKNNSVQGHWY